MMYLTGNQPATVNNVGKSRHVVLVSMPFGPLNTPSIGLGLLAAILKRRGHSVSTLYLTIDFAKEVGADLYSAIAQGDPGNHLLLGEWLFRDALFGASSQDNGRDYLKLFDNRISAQSVADRGRWKDIKVFEDEVRFVRKRTDAFIEQAARRILSSNPAIVGLTSVFQQQVASLAVAKEIKRLAPGTVTVMGGANVEAEMGHETLNQFEQIDYVVSGEADESFPLLVETLLDHGVPRIPGVSGRHELPGVSRTNKFIDLDSLPVPDYADYFKQWAVCGLKGSENQRLLFESSRGCWWGEIQHCTFCGLNGNSMAFRSKSADRALSELKMLTTSYPVKAVSVVDNIISMKYFSDFLPKLRDSGMELDLFYEVKANLKRDQVSMLKQANVNTIQPGIESLSDSVLKLMRKGVSAIQNIQLLKWCAELDVDPRWNFIWGFPFEEPDAYHEMRKLIPLIRHLPAPTSSSSIRLDRFSPNFNEASTRGFHDVRPFEAYFHVYPLPKEAVRNLAYYFEFSYPPGQDVDEYIAEFLEETRVWQANEKQYHFFSTEAGGRLLLWDFRGIGNSPLMALSELQSLICRSCEMARTNAQIFDLVSANSNWGEEEIEAALETLTQRGIILFLGNKYLNLATSTADSDPDVSALCALRDFVSSVSENVSGESRLNLEEYTL
jgi:ribosomal peptide maturation radical SAM protein 1